jgi:hypothetical protein
MSCVTEESWVLTMLLGFVCISEEACINLVELPGEKSILYDWEFQKQRGRINLIRQVKLLPNIL